MDKNLIKEIKKAKLTEKDLLLIEVNEFLSEENIINIRNNFMEILSDYGAGCIVYPKGDYTITDIKIVEDWRGHGAK